MQFPQAVQTKESLKTPNCRCPSMRQNIKLAPKKQQVEELFTNVQECVKQLNFDDYDIDVIDVDNQTEIEQEVFSFQQLNKNFYTPQASDKNQDNRLTPSTKETLSTQKESNLTSNTLNSEQNQYAKSNVRSWEEVSYKIDFQNGQQNQVDVDQEMKMQPKYFE